MSDSPPTAQLGHCNAAIFMQRDNFLVQFRPPPSSFILYVIFTRKEILRVVLYAQRGLQPDALEEFPLIPHRQALAGAVLYCYTEHEQRAISQNRRSIHGIPHSMPESAAAEAGQGRFRLLPRAAQGGQAAQGYPRATRHVGLAASAGKAE